MAKSALKENLIREIQDMPAGRIKDVLDFVHYLKIKEDNWFIDLVNARTRKAEADLKSGKKFVALKELQKEYRKR
jgi:hypothetical protein